MISRIISKLFHINDKIVVVYMDKKGEYKEKEASLLTAIVLTAREKKAERDYNKMMKKYY